MVTCEADARTADLPNSLRCSIRSASDLALECLATLHVQIGINNAATLVSVRRLLESFESLGFYGAHLDSRRGLQCGRTRTGRSTTAIT